MLLRMKNLNISGVHWKIRIFIEGEEFIKNQYRGGGLPKYRSGLGLASLPIEGGAIGKKEGEFFLSGVLIP